MNIRILADMSRRSPRTLANRLLLAVTLVAAVAGCSTVRPPPSQLASAVKTDRFAGGWFIVATIPNWFERGMVAPYDAFLMQPNREIKEDFRVQWGSFESERKHYTTRISVRPGGGDAHWRVHFGPINLPFLLIYADPDYRYLLWGEEDRSLGWIYSRTSQIDGTTYAELLGRFKGQGYDVSKFRRVVQRPEDVEQPGFWSEGIERGTGRDGTSTGSPNLMHHEVLVGQITPPLQNPR